MASTPERFGPYRIVRRIGVGGMAETFLAVRRGPGGFEQRVCLKRVLPAFEQDRKFIAQFMEEARIAASLRHSHIVSVIDVGEVDGAHFMALELVEGVDLRTLLEHAPDRRLTPEQVTLLAIDLAHALHYAHGLNAAHALRDGDPGGALGGGIVHRDISPSNILVSYAGEVKLADFGIAKAMRNASASASGTVKGKIPYMSPEQARGDSLDGRSDLFAFGVVLFECLVGKRPYDGASDVATLSNVLTGARTHAEDSLDGVPEALRAIVEQLLVRDREERFQGAEAVIAALAAFPAPLSTTRLAFGKLALAARGRDAFLVGAGARDAEHAAIGYEHTYEQTEALTGMGGGVADGPRGATEVRSEARALGEPTRTQVPHEASAPDTAPTAGNTPSGIAPKRAHKRPEHSEAALSELQKRAAEAEGGPTRASRPEALRAERRTESKRYGVAAVAVIGVLGLLAAGAWALVPGGRVPEGRAPEVPAQAMETLKQVNAPANSAPPASMPIAAAAPGAAPSQAEPVAQAAAAETETAPAPETARAATSDLERAAGERGSDARLGQVRVTAVPWGNIWVDSKLVGRAPRSLKLAAGAHSVSVGGDAPATTETITVRAGKRKGLMLEWQPQ